MCLKLGPHSDYQGSTTSAFQLEAFRTKGEWPDKQGVRIMGSIVLHGLD